MTRHDGSDKQPVRVGLVGCGRWGRLILRDLVRLGCDVHVAVPSPESRQAAVDSGAVAAVEKVGRLPTGLDGYVVAVPTNMHARIIEQLLDRERPIYVEKPLTDDPGTAQSLAAAAGERVFVMDKWRYHGAIQALAALVESKELGGVQSMQSVRAQCGQPHDDVDATWILLPHDLSIVLHVLGCLPPVRAAFGEGVGSAMESAIAFLGDNPRAAVQVTSLWPAYNRMVRVLFEDGIASMVDPMDNHILLHRFDHGRLSRDRVERRRVDTEAPLLKELRAFVGHLEGGPPPLSSAADGAAIARTISEVHRMAGF